MSDATREEYKLINEKLQEMAPIFQRMDEDEKLYFLDPYKMMMLYPDDSKEAKDVANVTLNDPLTYAKKVMAILGRYERQTVVEGQGLTDKKTTAVEEFTDDMGYAIDKRLVNRGLISMDAYIKEQASIRGRIGARSYIKLDKEGKLISDVLPVDTRHLPYDAGADGMTWGAVLSTRSKSKLQQEYGDEIGAHNITLSEANGVRDFWNPEKNVVFIGEKIVLEQENPYGFVPMVVSICPSGSTLSSDNAKKHEGESIFWPNRDLYKELNAAATIFKTTSLYSLFQSLQRESDNPQAEGAPEMSPWKPRTVHFTPKGMQYAAMPMVDIKAAAIRLLALLEARQQRGGLTALDFGNLTFPLSGVSIQSLLGARDDILWPMLHTIAYFLQSLNLMIIKQCVSLGDTIQLGKPENTYSKADLEGEYTINYKFVLSSKEQRIADLSLANAATGVFSMDTIRREIVGCQNPDQEDAKWHSEQAEAQDDVLRHFRQGLSLLYEAEDLTGEAKRIKQMEAKTLMQRIRTIMAQRRAMGQLSPMEGKETPKAVPKELLSLVGGGAEVKKEVDNAE